MYPQLHQEHHHTTTLLESVYKLAQTHFVNLEKLPPGRWVDNISFRNLPEQGLGSDVVLETFKKEVAPYLTNSAGPRYFGFVTGGSTPAALIGDQLVSMYDQNAFGSNDSIAPQIEQETIHLLRQLLHLDETFSGSFVTGATISNFTNLAIARQWAGEQQGVDVSKEGSKQVNLAIASATVHSSCIKSLSMLGIGRNNITKINTLPDREAIDVNALEYFLKENKHQACIVIANAGTVNTGDFDDLVAINELKKQYNFWLHVDGAFGAFAIISENHKHLMKGINHADSITIDAHKWLNVPYDAAMQFSKHKNLQLKVFQNSAAYLGDPSESPDFFHYTPENSRRWRALPTWFTLMAYGRHGQSELVTRCCTLASSLGERINHSQYFTLLSPVRLNIVCFTLAKENTTSKDIADFLQAIRDDGRAFFTPTVYKGIPAIRAAFSNWLTQKRDVEIAYQALEEVYIKMQHGKEK